MNYKVLSQDYHNTGGNCMVSSFTVYDKTDNSTKFVLVNELNGQLVAVDYIGQHIAYDEKMLLDEYYIDELQETDDNFELYQYCIIESAKKDCEFFETTVRIPWHILPANIQQTASAEYVKWHLENVADYFATDGKRIIYESDYEVPEIDCDPPQVKLAKEMLAAMDKAMGEWTDDDESMVVFNNIPLMVGFGDKILVMENNAALFNAVDACLREFIDSY